MTATSLNLGASLVGLAMAAVIVFPRRRMQEVGFATLLTTLAIASAMITLQHNTHSRAAIDIYERVEFLFGLLAGPILYLYTREEALRPRDALHAAPLLILLFGLPPITLMMAQQFVYTSVSASIVYRRRAFWGWPARIIAAFIVIHVAQIVRLTFSDVAVLRNVVPTVMSLVVLTGAVAGFRSAIVRAPKYAKSPLTDPETLMRRLREVVVTDRAYANPALSLDSLAAKLGVSPHLVSRVFNERLGLTFYEFVNRFRVEDLCALLKDRSNDRFTIDALAERSGFASRSAFYAAFKRQVGMTPTEYRRVSLSMPIGADKSDAP
jgi:AraC-like DNA-binding protein